mmetsp:Transcript_112707/g.291225  ORF Transcript_112707/g.291225 Transcript_112707/m.291225 type:complete len:325 (-) Transcript_112707:568-1542(-)
MDFHAVVGQCQRAVVEQSGHAKNCRVPGSRSTAQCGHLIVSTPVIDDLRKSVATSPGHEWAHSADAPMISYQERPFQVACEEPAHQCMKIMKNNLSSPLKLGSTGEVHHHVRYTSPQRATRLCMEAKSMPPIRSIEYGADDLFETVPIDTFVFETGKAYSPTHGECDVTQVLAHEAYVMPLPSLTLPSDRTGSPCSAVLPPPSRLVHEAPSSASHESLLKDMRQRHASQDSLATCSTTSGLAGQGDLGELLEEGAPGRKKSEKKRFSKAKRDRYRRLVESLVLRAKDDPASFNISEHMLPPAIASSRALKLKLLATVMKFALQA